MVKSGLALILTLSVFPVAVIPTAALAQASADYAIPAMVLSGGGVAAASVSYKMTGTVGQPSPVGSSTSSGYVLQMGFRAEAPASQAAEQDFTPPSGVELEKPPAEAGD